MEITYDEKLNIGYIKIRDKMDNVNTISVSSEVNLDISADGKIYGIELLNANEQLKLSGGIDILVKNINSGIAKEIHL